MSDFFMSNNENTQQEDELDRIRKQKEEYLAQQKAEAQRQDRERLENRQMFGVELNDDEYAQINKLIADSPDYEQEAHRIGSALLLARNFDTDFTDAYVNIDNYSQALYGKTEPVTDYKNFFGVVKDSIMIGTNGLTLGNLGNRLKAAEIDNDTELVNKILEEIDLINKDNELRQDNAPRSWITEQIRDGMQTLPFSAQAAGLAFFGNFVLPGAGTALSFASTSAITAGQEYIDLREKGVSPEVARKVSNISGGIQGLIEVSLGEALDYGIAGATKNLSKTASSKLAQKVTGKFAKLFHYGNDAKLIADILGAKAWNVTTEGLEEAAQQIVSIGSRHIAESMEGLDLSDETVSSITQEITDAFRGGVVGAIVLGLPLDVANVNADVKNYKFVKQQAKETQSFEMFYENNKDNPVFNNIKEDKRREYIKDVWKQAQSENEAEINLRAKEYGEVTGTENFEQAEVDEETGDETIEKEFREDTGMLHSQNVVISEDDGIIKGVYGVGDPTKQNDNKYAEINYTADEKNKTVTIDSLKVGKSRQNLRNEVYDNFARNFPGYDIQWNAIGKVAQEWKQQFTEANPQGRNAGLNYYQSTDDIADVSTRRQVVSQIKQAYQKAGKTLTDKQLAADTVILESLYRRLREQQDFKDRGIDSFSKYVSYTFGNNIFGESDKVTQAAQQQYGEGVKAQGASIPRSLQELDQDIKAVVYVTENGDFSTFSHEIAHIARKQLTGDLLKQVEDALGVTDGNWTIDKEEKFAYGFEQFLREGKVENEALRPFYEKVAQFLTDVYNRLKNVIQMTPDIEKVYNELLSKGDEGILAAAERAVEQEANAARMAEQERQQQETEQAKAEEQQQKVTEEEQNIDNSEVMFNEEENKLTWEEKAAIVEKEEKEKKEYYKNLAPKKIEEAQKKMAKRQDAKPSLKMSFESLLGLPDSYERYKTLQTKLLQFGPKDVWWNIAQAETERLFDKYKDEQISRLFKEENQVKETLDNTTLPTEEKKRIENVLTDEESSLTEKTSAADEAAEDSYQFDIFQLIGEMGATNLDRVEEVTTRMDNLAIAREMFKAGKTVERIRLATGWEMGADAQWRYEIADDYKFKNNIKTNRKLKRYKAEQQEAEKKLAVYTEATEEEANKIRRKIEIAVQHGAMPEGTTFESMQQEAQNEVDMYKNLIKYDGDLDVEQSLRDFIENGVSDPDNFWDIGESFRLNQIIDNEELFNAYPQLEHYVIEFTRKRNGLSGRLNPEDKIITIYPPAAISFAAFKSTIAHEIQHAIQHIEGFAEGGSTNLFKEAVKPTEMQENIMLLAGIPKDQLLNYKNHEEWKTLKEYLPEALEKDIYGLGTLEQIMDRWLNDVENGVRTIDGIYEEIQNARQDYDKYHKINGYENEKSPIEKYRSLAGEVEARNVQRRLNMSAIQRLNTLLLDTEDIDRNEQLIYRNAVEMAAEEARIDSVLESDPIIEINTKDFNYDENNLKQAAIDYITNNPQGTVTTEIGDIVINEKGIENSVSHTLYPNKLFSIPAIKPTLEQGVYLGVLKDFEGERQNNYYFAAPIKIDNEDKILFVRVKHVAGRDKLFYIHDVFTSDEIKKAVPYSGESDTTRRSLRGTALARSIIQDYEINNTIQNDKLLFQTEAPTLYGVHNLSEDALKHVFKMGGLANPSFAVVDKELQIHTNFGDISLIAYNSLIEKSTGRNAGTFGADVYSPRYPRANRFLTDRGYDTIEALFNNVEDNGVKINLIEGLKQKIEDTSFNEKYPEYTTLPVAYLLKKGDNSFWKREKSKFSDEVLEKVKSFGDYADFNTPGVQEFLTEYYKNDLYNSWRMAEVDERIKNGTATETDKSDRTAYDEAVKGSLDPETGMLNYRQASDILYSMQRDVRNAGKIDYLGSKINAQNAVENDQDFKKWAKDIIESIEVEEKLFNGFTPSGNRRYLAYTLENVSKLMKAKSVRGGESMNYGMGSARAMVTPKFSTLKQIRAAKDKLTDTETFKKIKDELQEEYYWVTELLQGTMDDYDAGDYRFAEAIEKGYFDADYIRKEYKDVTMSEEDEQRIKEFVQAMKEMPTEYFETKFERPIYTTEFNNSFAAAVLPEATDPKFVKELEDMGIAVYSYKDSSEREAVTIKALDEINKTRKVLFQTQAELYADARTFPTWQEFMNFYETMGKPEITPIPYDADAQWYQTTWELANNVTPEESIINEELKEKYAGEGTTPKALDSLFVANIVENDDALMDFLSTLSAYDSIDLNSDEWANVETREEAEDRQRIADLQSYMKTYMYSRSWRQAMASLKAGNEPTAIDLRNIKGEMRDDFKSRDFRSLYYEVTGDETYKVDDKDRVTTTLENRRAKHPERYFDIIKSEDEIENASPERRKQISKDMDNADLASDIRSGKLKMDDKVHNYIKLLDKQIAGLQQQLTDQEIEAENDYKLIADVERRELLKLHDKMLLAKGQYKGTNDYITRRLNKGIRISSKYARENQNLKANYDELYRKFQDLKSLVVIDSQVEAALKRQEQIHEIKEEISTKQQEKSRAAEEKKLRVQLVKRAMRRVDFKKIDYEDAKTIIAIQRIFEPNLMGGVNRWIGTEGPFLRGVISGILTDVEYKEAIEKYLRNNSKASKAYLDFVELLKNTKTLEDFNKWTQKDRKAALRYLPKENWLKDLNLVKLAKEREESIDLDINMVEKQKPAIDPKTGLQKTYKDADGENKPVYTTAFVVEYSDEIAQRVRDAVGADMFDNMVNVPFADWTFEQLEEFAMRINELYTRGRDTLEGKKLARKEAADKIRNSIEQTVKNTGIIINDDDDEETKKRKLEKINKILGLEGNNTKGSETSQEQGFKARINRILHSYNDANVLRVARILDGYSEGTNYQELYRKEDTCYNNKTRSMNDRAKNIQKVMQENNITPSDLATVIQVKVPNFTGTQTEVIQEYTIDDLLYFLAASKDYATNDNGSYDQYAACSRNAVMYGNMFASQADLEEKQRMAEDETLDPITNQSISQQSYIERCRQRFEKVLEAAENLDPKYKALLEAIEKDYAAQYDRMNEVSVNVFNAPVHRVKCYVPLVRLESNGDTNTNKVKEDLLAAMGANATRQGVNKGMTQRRVRMNPFNQKPVETGLYRTWSNSVERTEHFIAYSQYVDELNRVYKSRDAQFTRQFIESRYGKGMLRYIDDYINEVANPNANKIREAGAELLHTFRGRTAPAYLAWKASSIVKQGLTSPWPFMQYINPAEYLAASWKAITSKGEIYKAIKEKSVYMNNRVMDPMNDLIDEMAEQGKNKFDRFMGKQSQIGMKGLEWIDWVCVAPGWYAAYQKEYARLNGNNQAVYEAEKERLTEENLYAEVNTSAWKTPEQIEALAQKAMEDDVEKRAVQYADDITRACQPSNRAVDLAPLFKNSSEAMKVYLQFQTSLNVIWQNIKYDTQYIAKKPDAVAKEQFMQISGIIIGYALAGIFMNSVMEGLGGDDEDEKLKNLIYYATTQFTDAVPMIGGELTNTMDKLITGKASYSSSGTDMTPTVTKLLSILTNAKSGNWDKAAQMTAEGIGMYFGLPVSGLKEIEKIAGIGDKEPGLDVDLSKVYGILED